MRCSRFPVFFAHLVALSSCARDHAAAAQALDAANGLATAGQLAAALAAFAGVCQTAPTAPACGTAAVRAAQVRLQAAEQSRAAGDSFAAQRLAIVALLSPEDATRQKAQELLASEPLKAGIEAQRARVYAPAAAARGEDEEKRQRPLRKEADTFLHVFAATEKKRVAFEKCLERTGDNPTGDLLTALCREEIYQDNAEDGYRTRYTKERTDAFQWRRILRELRNDALAQEYERKKTQAIADAKLAAEKAAAGR